ncbi:hypothetical protein A2U01_0039696 [Trifolium medium]|uniref:Uncharacterized protein n=1 Tax=Trifolium medium TaxID=97028 RepID=A0A392Q3S2_9FABA|nr:hypothetical protein [Trifolium medium]
MDCCHSRGFLRGPPTQTRQTRGKRWRRENRPLVLMTAAQFFEAAFDIEDQSFSYHLMNILEEINGDVTYKELVGRINHNYVAQGHPNCGGLY